MISVITPSIRPEGLVLVQKAIKRQTFKKFEWIVCSPMRVEFTAKWIPDDSEGGFWSLNRAYNKLIRKAKGELIVSWQDHTYADPTALEKFWHHYVDEPQTIVGAVGNKYSDETFTVKTWQDPRERDDLGSFYSVFPNDIEWNLCAVPREALYDVGGFDEHMDFLGFGMDGYGVNERIDFMGVYDFKLDQSIKTYSTEHKRPKGWDDHNLLTGGYTIRKQDLVDAGKWPRLDYL